MEIGEWKTDNRGDRSLPVSSSSFSNFHWPLSLALGNSRLPDAKSVKTCHFLSSSRNRSGILMIPIRYNLRSIVVRRVGTAMTIAGVALTVAVFVSILAMVQGLQNTFQETGHPLNLI